MALRLDRWPLTAEGAVDRRVDALVERLVAGLLGLPDIDVAQPTLGQPHCEVQEQPLHRLWPDSLVDTGVEVGVDRHVLREGVHARPFLLVRTNFG